MKVSLLLVVCLIAVSGSKGPLSVRAEADIDALAAVDDDAPVAVDLGYLNEPEPEVDEKDVFVLSEKNFKDIVLTSPYALVRALDISGMVFLCAFSLCEMLPVSATSQMLRRLSSTHHGVVTVRCFQSSPSPTPTHTLTPTHTCTPEFIETQPGSC